MSVTYRQQIEAHYATVWPAPPARLRWTLGPVHQLPSDFGVLQIARTAKVTAYATTCMSQPADPDRLELHALSRATDPLTSDSITEVLTVIAHYHRHGPGLGVGHTVNFGRPWTPGSLCTDPLRKPVV